MAKACLVWYPKSSLLAFPYTFGEDVGTASSSKIWYFCWLNRRWRCFFMIWDFWCFLRLLYDRFLFILRTVHHYTFYCRPLFIIQVPRYFLRLFWSRFLFIVWVCINKLRSFWYFLKLFYGMFLFIVWVCINKLRIFWYLLRLFYTGVFPSVFLDFCSSSLESSDAFLGSFLSFLLHFL